MSQLELDTSTPNDVLLRSELKRRRNAIARSEAAVAVALSGSVSAGLLGAPVVASLLFLCSLGIAAALLLRLLNGRRFRRAAQEGPWRMVDLSRVEDSVTPIAHEPGEAVRYRFAEPIPRHFTAYLAESGRERGRPSRWCAIRPLETDRVLVAKRLRRRAFESWWAQQPSDAPSRWSTKDAQPVTCSLTPAGLTFSCRDGGAGRMATLVVKRDRSDGRFGVWLAHGRRVGHVVGDRWDAELLDAFDHHVVERQRRFDAHVFLSGEQVRARAHGSIIEIDGRSVICRTGRTVLDLPPIHSRVGTANGDVLALARRRPFSETVQIRISSDLDPVEAAIVLLNFAAVLVRYYQPASSSQ